MSRADELFIENCKEILAHGVWDTEQEVRPRWTDGAPAHTVKKFGIVNRYDLRAEFPVQTIRKMAFKSAVDELLWIWQKKSNNIHDLSSHIWTRAAPSARPTATSWGSSTATPRGSLTRWTGCSTISSTTRPPGGF